MKTIRSVKGMHDIMNPDIDRWHFVEQSFQKLVERFGYEEIRTPILEPLELFVRGIGEVTDIVEKEMYEFVDKGGDHLALRPEGTASAIRSYVQHNIDAKRPQTKWYYIGPMFRRERPAKGRYRQFFQAGAELIGAASPAADAEIIDMAVQFIEGLGIENVSVQINSLGSEQTRPKFREALVEYLSEFKQSLCQDCNRRIEVNPLRVIDCKAEKCKEIASKAPSILEYLSSEDAEHFGEVKRLLERNGTPFEVVPSMVRGLDYYTRTIFEVQVKSDALGAGSAIVGGGRYDNLIKQLGGRPTPTIGFAFGIERLVMLLPQGAQGPAVPLTFVAGVGPGGLERALEVARNLRLDGYKVEVSYSSGSLRSQLKKANKFDAAITVIAGEDEATRGSVTCRNMKDGSQKEVLVNEIAGYIEAVN